MHGTQESLGPNVALEFTRDSPMSRRQIEAFQESMANLRKLVLQLISLGTDFIEKTRASNKAAVKFAAELSKREYSRLLFTNCFPDVGDLSTEILGFSATVCTIAKTE
eukprot:CAMPEP_0185761386 /NCGR_PEP_ID=MMETSP1174-20130828/20310_1 /TAXON_ID=35687 /ORGANISM="Dictyocha speculum, Strain CCMP1381" /LENGTH=107 /DNA_ID=CAMNT_0028442607 /DNA_START=12 /DNA_END=332 /DNA_ORIENTATION=-